MVPESVEKLVSKPEIVATRVMEPESVELTAVDPIKDWTRESTDKTLVVPEARAEIEKVRSRVLIREDWAVRSPEIGKVRRSSAVGVQSEEEEPEME